MFVEIDECVEALVLCGLADAALREVGQVGGGAGGAVWIVAAVLDKPAGIAANPLAVALDGALAFVLEAHGGYHAIEGLHGG